MYTPWGRAQNVEILDRDGIVWVSTASHGGLRISKICALAKNITQAAIAQSIETDEHFWFEEDCAWAVIAWELKYLWNYFFKYMAIKNDESAQMDYLLKSITYWYPTYALIRGLIDLDNLPADRIFCPGTPKNRYCPEARLIAKHRSDDNAVIEVVCAECGRSFWSSQSAEGMGSPQRVRAYNTTHRGDI